MTETGKRIGHGFLAVALFSAALLLAYLAWSAFETRAVTVGKIEGFRTATVDRPPPTFGFLSRRDTDSWMIYSYEVAGKIYRNEVSDHDYGEVLTVYYDPGNPRISRIGKPRSPLLLGGLALLGLVGGALAARRARRPRVETNRDGHGQTGTDRGAG
jgi:hypothetical protein